MFSSSLSKVLPRLIKLFNGFSLLHYKKFILLNKNMLYGSLDIICPFMYDFKDVPHSIVELHRDTLKNSSQLKAEVIIFLAIQSNLAFLLSVSVQSDEGLSIETSSLLT